LHLLGFDTGGTYTDAVLFDPARGAVAAAAKALTTKHNLAIGLRGAMEAVLRQLPVDDIGFVSLSTTLATNAIVEGQGSPICLLLMGYEPSALDRAGLRRALGHDPVCFIAGGHSATGDEQAPLDLPALEAAVHTHDPNVAAFAVSGFFSVRNPAHDLAARELIGRLTGKPVSCGHELTSKLDAPRRAKVIAAEIDENGDAPFRPGGVDGREDRLDAGAEAAIGIATAPGERHLVADHLAHHVGGAFGNQWRMRDDDDADIAHAWAPSTLAAVRMISALERAPGST
jgi:hypothetical protein